MLTQIHEVKSFLTQQTASSSRGPCSLSHDRVNIETQLHAARAYAAEFNNNEAGSVALHENTNPQMYQISHSVIKSIGKVLSETQLKFSSKLMSFHSQTWLLLLVCLGKCFSLESPKKCCSI